MSNNIRLRFAPSPTGPLHIGGLRTALYNYLITRKLGGKFILRIEDTDLNRLDDKAIKHIEDSLNWCGILPDESPKSPGKFGPYFQSKRKDLYKKYIEKLIKNGSAYYAFDKKDELSELRKKNEKEGKTFIYNWLNRDKLKNSLSLNHDESKNLIHKDEYVIRFKTYDPLKDNDEYYIEDIIRGEVKINLKNLDDKIIYKSDGMPTYHLANIVDDHLMKITHVVRGEEWLPSLALHFKIYEAFGWKKPFFAHLPLILKPSGQGKLSKRDGQKFGIPVYPIEWNDSKEKIKYLGFKEMGFEPEAILNFICMIGWNPGDEKEVFSLKELETIFSLDKINKSGAKFDFEKAKWFNHEHVKKISDESTLKFMNENIDKNFLKIVSKKSKSKKLIELIKERVTFKKELIKEARNILDPNHRDLDQNFIKKKWNEKIYNSIIEIIKLIKNSKNISIKEIKKSYLDILNKNEIKIGDGMQSLRLCLIKNPTGPDIFEIIEILGLKESINRIHKNLIDIND